MKPTVTATISTLGRYFTTLPLAIQGIVGQTRPPEQFILFDDGEQKDLRSISPFNHLFRLLDMRGIRWQVVFGQRRGQVANHQTALERADTDMVWRLDDDDVPDADCLETLLSVMADPKVGAAGGLVLQPGAARPRPAFLSGRLDEIFSGINIQWCLWDGEPAEVDHLYSTFLYRVDAGRKAGGYCLDLSLVGHREETIFSHEIKRAGYRVVATPDALTWHLHEETGGIRSFKDASLWEHDEKVFASKLAKWGVSPIEHAFFVLDNGMGDHVVFRSILPEIRARHRGKRLVIAACYPEIFADDRDVTLISIADARSFFGDVSRWNVYKWCEERDWRRPLADAFRGMYA